VANNAIKESGIDLIIWQNLGTAVLAPRCSVPKDCSLARPACQFTGVCWRFLWITDTIPLPNPKDARQKHNRVLDKPSSMEHRIDDFRKRIYFRTNVYSSHHSETVQEAGEISRLFIFRKKLQRGTDVFRSLLF
jgi:hypothetical protein